MRIKGKITLDDINNKGVISLDSAERYMNYFGEIYDIHNRLSMYVPKTIVDYYERPVISSGYSMGEVVKVFFNGHLISEEDFTSKYRSGKYRGRENHGLIVVNFPTKKKLREYLEAMKILTIKEQNNRTKGKITSEDILEENNLRQSARKLLLDCVLYEESRIKKGYQIY